MHSQKQGVIFAIAAFLMWGLAPIYFKAIDHVAAMEILLHRVVWSVLFLLVILTVVKKWRLVKSALFNVKTAGWLLLSAALLGFNWGLFIWSVNNNHMLDASLGYYINPLLNVLLGMLFLSERLRRLQLVAVVLAVTGVVIQLISFGSFPIIAFSLASSFALYGLIRKKLPVDTLPGLLIESLFMLPVALIYWWGLDTPTSDLTSNSVSLNLLLISAGIVTTLPLLCFTAAARRIQYSTLGFFQYIGPSLMFILAVLFYGETFSADRMVTFGFIWSALALFSFDSYRNAKRAAVNPQ